MIKELRYLFFLVIIFFFFSFKFYFSEDNMKKSYRSLKKINERINAYSKNLIILNSDTENIIEYINKNEDNNKKVFNFWKLIYNDK